MSVCEIVHLKAQRFANHNQPLRLRLCGKGVHVWQFERRSAAHELCYKRHMVLQKGRQHSVKMRRVRMADAGSAVVGYGSHDAQGLICRVVLAVARPAVRVTGSSTVSHLVGGTGWAGGQKTGMAPAVCVCTFGRTGEAVAAAFCLRSCDILLSATRASMGLHSGETNIQSLPFKLVNAALQPFGSLLLVQQCPLEHNGLRLELTLGCNVVHLWVDLYSTLIFMLASGQVLGPIFIQLPRILELNSTREATNATQISHDRSDPLGRSGGPPIQSW
ncbi:hypothetical protein BC831DRAFT_236485 [Entophlyctis helioformis]|nr:hypothetical protein BC831DRAFT_236485 [Entophlyctis helioformis]